MTKVLTLLVILQFAVLASNAQSGVAVNQNGAMANAYAILDVSSITKGMLIPRMSQSQLTAIQQPANGLMVFNIDDDKLYIYYSSDNKWQPVAYAWDVVTDAVGTWIDRNLGATEVATSKTDANAYGDLYQWGRAADGHEKRNSPVTSTLATTSAPDQGNSWDGEFITNGSAPYDWLQTQDNNLWQGVDGVNNPCPPGFRLPTQTEWNDERQSWATNDDDGAFGSPLKLSLAGRRLTPNASLNQVGTDGIYWSSTVNGNYSRALHFKSGAANMGNRRRALGATVRCIKSE